MTQQQIKTCSRLARLETMPPSFSSYCSHLRRRDCSARTLESYADCLLIFGAWLSAQTHRSPLDCTTRDLETFRHWLVNDYRSPQGRCVSLGRQAYYIAVLRGYYSWCRDQRLILVDPAADLAYPKTPKRLHRDILTPEELIHLLDTPGDDAHGKRDQVALRVMALSGLRVSEAIAVTLDDLNLTDRELIVRRGKGGKQRLTFIDVTTQPIVAAYLLGARPVLAARSGSLSLPGALLVSDAGQPFNREQLLRIVARHARRAKIAKTITNHSLRRTFATLMLKSASHSTSGGGLNLKMVADLMGHARLSTTARYAQVDIDMLHDVYDFAHPCATLSAETTESVA